MSDKSRRRKARDSGDSEKLSEDSYEDSEIIKGSEEEGEVNVSNEGARESEYETVGDSESENSTAVDEEEDDDDSVIVEYEREEGDGQESIPPKEKKLDDDEDRRNPQYIPKRGTFYEHDDRTATEDVTGETNEKEAADRASKEGQGGGDSKSKKVWREHENRWDHDRYNEDEQAPKSREELIAIYGYDIRNEEGPPRARRRRRYGRGPNKYTRNWEDEDAYGKPQATTPSVRGGRRGGRRGGSNQTRRPEINRQEDFPPLINNRQENKELIDRQENNSSSVNQNLPTQGSTYSNRTIAGKKQNKEDRSSNRNSQQEAFPPLDSESFQNQNSGTSESSNNNKSQISSSNNNTNKEESDGILNSIGSRQVRDTRDGPFIDNEPRRGRGRARTRGGRGARGGGMVVAPKTRGQIRNPSATRLPPNFVSHPHCDMGNESALPPPHQDHHQHPGASLAGYQTNRSQQDETSREFHRRSSKGGSNQPQHHPQQQLQQSQSVPGSERRQQVVVPPRLQHQQQQQQDNSGSNRPKRYSSLRQRTLPESGTTFAQQPPTNTYYPSTSEIETNDDGTNHTKRYPAIQSCSGPVYAPADPSPPTYFQPAGYVTQQPVYGDTPQHPQSAGTPPLQLLPHPPAPAYAAPFPSPTTTFVAAPPPPRMLPPGAAAPPTYIPTPTPGTPILNYVPTPQYTAFQGYPAVAAPVPPPTELYQPQGGITYYNTEEQTIVPRPITQKRQRSAIPILPPPDQPPKGRGRTNREGTVSPGELGGAGDSQSVPPAAEPSPPDKFEDAPSSPPATPTATKVA